MKAFHVVYITSNQEGALDINNEPLPEGIHVIHNPEMYYENPKEGIEDETDWDGLYSGRDSKKSKILFVLYFSEDGKEIGIVREPLE